MSALAITAIVAWAQAVIEFVSHTAPPEKTTFVILGNRPATSVAISADGRTLAFTARDAAGKFLLWVRPTDSLTAQPASCA